MAITASLPGRHCRNVLTYGFWSMVTQKLRACERQRKIWHVEAEFKTFCQLVVSHHHEKYLPHVWLSFFTEDLVNWKKKTTLPLSPIKVSKKMCLLYTSTPWKCFTPTFLVSGQRSAELFKTLLSATFSRDSFPSAMSSKSNLSWQLKSTFNVQEFSHFFSTGLVTSRSSTGTFKKNIEKCALNGCFQLSEEKFQVTSAGTSRQAGHRAASSSVEKWLSKMFCFLHLEGSFLSTSLFGPSFRMEPANGRSLERYFSSTPRTWKPNMVDLLIGRIDRSQTVSAAASRLAKPGHLEPSFATQSRTAKPNWPYTRLKFWTRWKPFDQVSRWFPILHEPWFAGFFILTLWPPTRPPTISSLRTSAPQSEAPWIRCNSLQLRTAKYTERDLEAAWYICESDPEVTIFWSFCQFTERIVLVLFKTASFLRLVFWPKNRPRGTRAHREALRHPAPPVHPCWTPPQKARSSSPWKDLSAPTCRSTRPFLFMFFPPQKRKDQKHGLAKSSPAETMDPADRAWETLPASGDLRAIIIFIASSSM